MFMYLTPSAIASLTPSVIVSERMESGQLEPGKER